MTNRRSSERSASATEAGSSALSRVLGNSAWLIVAEGATRVVSLASILYLTRALDDASSLGAVQYGMAVFALLQLVCTGGTEALLTPEGVRNPDELPRLAGLSLLVSWAQFVVAFVLVVALLWARGMSPDMQTSAAIFGLAGALVPVTLRFAFLALERARVIGLGTLVGQIAFLGLCVAGVRSPRDVVRVGVFWLLSTAIRAAVQLVVFVRSHGALVLETRGFFGWLWRATRLSPGSIARGLMLNVDVLVLGLFRPADEVARYALAVKLPLFVVSWSTFLYMSLFPTLARVADTERGARIEATTLEAVLSVALPGAVALWIAADPLTVVLFTDRFRDATPLLALLVWRIPLVAAAGVFRTGVWARHPRTDARVAVEMLAATVVVLAVLARAAGATGVAAGMLAGDALALVLYLHAGGMPALARVQPATIARLAAGVALTFGLGWAVPREHGIASVAGALAAWGVGTLVAAAPYIRRVGGELGRAVR